jgi:hypothetical protein
VEAGADTSSGGAAQADAARIRLAARMDIKRDMKGLEIV